MLLSTLSRKQKNNSQTEIGVKYLDYSGQGPSAVTLEKEVPL